MYIFIIIFFMCKVSLTAAWNLENRAVQIAYSAIFWPWFCCYLICIITLVSQVQKQARQCMEINTAVSGHSSFLVIRPSVHSYCILTVVSSVCRLMVKWYATEWHHLH